MRIIKTPDSSLKVWLTANDTYNWATRPGESWLCSFLRSRRVFAEFDGNGDLINLAIDGGRGDQDCPGDEFSACLSDHIASRYPNHPALRGEVQPV